MSNIGNQVADVRNTFSSWDQCMAKAYCKWPAIVGIVVGSLVLLTVLYCLSKIICCGAKCCFCFTDMAKCCCCGSGGSGGKTEHHHHYSAPPQGQGGLGSSIYGPQKSGYVDPRAYNSSGGPGYAGQGQYRSQAPPTYGVAQFDVPSKKAAARDGPEADALPAMPSWNDATSKRIEDPNALEMDKLERNGPSQGSLPKFETDDYKYGGPGSAQGGSVTGAAAVGAVGMSSTGASRYEDTPYRQNSYGPGAVQGGYHGDRDEHGLLDSQHSMHDPSQQQAYGAAGFASATHDSRQGYGQGDRSRFAQGVSGYSDRDAGHQRDAYGYDHQDQYSTQPRDAYSRQDQGYGQRSPSYTSQHGRAAYPPQSPTYGHSALQPRSPTFGQHNDYSHDSRGYNAPPSPPPTQQQHFQSYRSYSPVQSQAGSARQAYPSQQTYDASPAVEASLPPALSAGVNPAAPRSVSGAGPARKPVQGSWRDL